jgi:soluble lytic murein transglycosylase-like protein
MPLTDNQRKGLTLLLGTAAAWLGYRLAVSWKRPVDSAYSLTEGESSGLFETDFSPAQAAAFQQALPLAGQQYASLLVAAGRRHGLSPFILAGIMERETGYGAAGACRGKGPACIGSPNKKNPDYGLMQINSMNLASYGISNTWTDPAANIDAGARILKWTIGFFAGGGGSVVTVTGKNALRFVTTPGDKPDPRPFTDPRTLLWYGIAGYNAGPGNVIQAVASGRSPDAATTGNDYGAAVLQKAERIAADTALILSGQGTA